MNHLVSELIFIYRKFISDPFDPFLRPVEGGTKEETLFFDYLNNNPAEVEAYWQQGITERNEKKAFMMLRNQFIEKMIRYVLILNPKHITKSVFVLSFIDLIKVSSISRILMALGFNNSGVYLAKKATHRAIEIESWDIVLSLSSILNQFYALRANEKRAREYSDLADYALEAIKVSREMRGMLNKWTLRFGRKRKADAEAISLLLEDIKVADEILEKHPTPSVMHYNYRIKLFYYDATMDYETTIKLCEEARANLLAKQKIVDQNRLGIYHGTQMYCYLNLKRFDEAQVLAEQVNDFFNEGTLNWFISMEYYFVLSVQTANYSHAYELLEKAISAPTYNQLRGPRQQVWRLLEGYMQFIISSGLWEDKPHKIEVEQFRTTKFLNEVISLSWDKTGIQVSILILQIMFLLHQGKYEAIIDKKDALKRYVYRYLYTKENERSRVFLTLLLRVVELNFVYSEVSTRTKRLYNVLKSFEMNYLANLGGNEIVDYELLWEWVLETLKRNWSKSAT
ncbi:hypothetical protein GC194_02285 [bacterium]|nr:hypothetical protein [bacterium]